jgi:hypothetical protein
MSAACEATALGESPGTGAIDRGSRNHATWHRYLAPAMRLESPYGHACAVFAGKSDNANG